MMTRSKTGAIACMALVFLLSCDDLSQNSWYPNKEEVLAHGAIERGWIPEILPASARQIYEWHELDSNVGYGSFVFDATDYDALSQSLEPLERIDFALPRTFHKGFDWVSAYKDISSNQELQEAGFAFFRYEYFVLAINPEKGQAFFWNQYNWAERSSKPFQEGRS